jgi:hypothetical protein
LSKEVKQEKYRSVSILYPIDYQEEVWNTTRNLHNQGVPGSCPGGPTETKKALNESWGLFLEYYVNNFNPRKL